MDGWCDGDGPPAAGAQIARSKTPNSCSLLPFNWVLKPRPGMKKRQESGSAALGSAMYPLL